MEQEVRAIKAIIEQDDFNINEILREMGASFLDIYLAEYFDDYVRLIECIFACKEYKEDFYANKFYETIDFAPYGVGITAISCGYIDYYEYNNEFYVKKKFKKILTHPTMQI